MSTFKENADPSPVTELLQRWSDGDQLAGQKVLPLVYPELRRIAVAAMRRERADHTLQATALVHEAYLYLREQHGLKWENRTQFFGFAAHLLRRLLITDARRRNRAKRGGQWQRVTLAEAADVANPDSADLVDLDEALRSLESIDPQKARIVELRFFGGLTLEETASYLGISPVTVSRQWARARAWLFETLRTAGSPA
ncbi:MAG TPA: sigma-70 family RNA polymerase sigma factor [Thermoanaerobaculia bacterium]|nr:sigma-70 family RNA polymerase sigma factor [Thermoanaerobaculia bacterium]